ncbi:MAG TPA: endolytic transglycosylase MltG [Solirubrobacteraceae bacterium]
MSRGNRPRPTGERTAEERREAREERERRRAERSHDATLNGVAEQASPFDDQGPAFDHQGSAFDDQGPAFDDQGPASGDHGPAFDDEGARLAEDDPTFADPDPGAPALDTEAGYDAPDPADETAGSADDSHDLAAPAGDLTSQPPAPAEPAPPLAASPVPGVPVQPAPADPAQPEPAPEFDAGEPSGPAASSSPPVAPAAAAPPRAERGDALAPARRVSRGRRSALARLLAIAALAAVVAVVVLLVRSLSGSGHAKVASTPAAVRVLIPEGKTRVQIAQIAASDGLSGSYRSAAKRSGLLNPAHYGAPHTTPDLEGFLFPATYDMTPRAPVARLVDEQLVAFKENFGPQEIKRARALHVTPYQLLIIASMIEREAEVPGDRPKIAAVIYNRLHRGMPLGIDATIYYAVEQQTGIATYTRELTEAQLHMSSPYNTRNRPGLPPTPISNPGIASIQAAANPAHASYLYYVAAPDGCGEHVFSTSLAAFEANAAAYQAALKANGGRLPACKKK